MVDNSPAVQCSVGIDVSKDSLDIFIDSSAEVSQVRNQAGDIAALGRVSPQRVRSFARALGELAKTDRLDARLLARYGRDCRPPLSRLSDAETAELEALMQRRRQLIEMHVGGRVTGWRLPRASSLSSSGSTSGGWRSASTTRARSCGSG